MEADVIAAISGRRAAAPAERRGAARLTGRTP
jgi:hypothetical protein